MNDASTDTGSARPVMTVERHELRNRNTTSTVSTAPSISAFWTFRTEAATRAPASRTTRQLDARRQRLLHLRDLFDESPRLTVRRAEALSPS